jgi:hypothetical protein
MNENSMKSCMSVVLVLARMPARSGRHMAAKTGMTDQTWAQTQDHGGGQRETEGIGSVGGARGSRIGD